MRIFEFFKQQFLIAHVSNIPVRIDYRWFFVLALMSWATAISINSLIGNFFTSFLFGLITTLFFFVSIFLHELAHAFAARMEGVEVVEIVLHPFGGLARFRREPDSPRAEFRIAIAGPVASFMLSLVFLGLMAIFNLLGTNILAPFFFVLALGNFLLAVFNLFPGYPLDGGRVLRAYLRRGGTDLNEATILTGRIGQGIGAVMLIFGVMIALIRNDFFTGLWTILVGLFLYDAARSIISQTIDLEKMVVEDVMQLPVSVAPETAVAAFVDHVLPFHRQTVFPVAKDRQLYGILALEDLKKLAREDWRKTAISDMMRPITVDYFVEARTPLSEARKLMRENGIGALGVIDEKGNLVGFMQNKKRTSQRK